MQEDIFKVNLITPLRRGGDLIKPGGEVEVGSVAGEGPAGGGSEYAGGTLARVLAALLQHRQLPRDVYTSRRGTCSHQGGMHGVIWRRGDMTIKIEG